jgi:hypothetical protein
MCFCFPIFIIRLYVKHNRTLIFALMAAFDHWISVYRLKMGGQVRDVSVRSLTNWSWSIYEALKTKCCVFLLWGLNYVWVCDHVLMSAIKILSVCANHRHFGGAFGSFWKRLQAKVYWGLLILKFCSWNFVRLWKITKPCFRIGRAVLRQLKIETGMWSSSPLLGAKLYIW